jgi:hypothetical protein
MIILYTLFVSVVLMEMSDCFENDNLFCKPSIILITSVKINDFLRVHVCSLFDACSNPHNLTANERMASEY